MDARHIWHPFTQAKGSLDPICIVKAEGNKLYDHAGKTYLDMISSWWVNLHGHAHPKIASAIAEQAQKLEQVIFADFTHPPALELTKKLHAALPRENPRELNRFFFSDNGSTAVESAIKMALHYWRNKDQPQRRKFIALEGAYHGDTVGAMSVGMKSGFFDAYKSLCFDVLTIPFPAIWHGDKTAAEKEKQALSQLKNLLSQHDGEIAGFIFEPMVLGAAGMKMCGGDFIRDCANLARQSKALVIFDEVMTGFGRTGSLFAYEQCKITPDILCLAKGLSGGFLPLAVTVAHEDIYEAFLGDGFGKALAHGHSYTANPMACAAAIASMDLLLDEESAAQREAIKKSHQNFIDAGPYANLEKLRVKGTILAADISGQSVYGGKLSQDLKLFFLNRGLLIRPIGNTLYILPPYCTTEQELKDAYHAIVEAGEIFGDTAISLVA